MTSAFEFETDAKRKLLYDTTYKKLIHYRSELEELFLQKAKLERDIDYALNNYKHYDRLFNEKIVT